MTELFEPVDVYDWRVAAVADPVLTAYNEAGVLTSGQLRIAGRISALAGEDDVAVVLAVALTVRAVAEGSVCLDLDRIAEIAPELPWPEPTAWRAAVAGSRVVAEGALVLDHGLLYLDRYHRLEVAV
ncbi:MAG: exodeoxyribonuclease V subunit alpha, partial [Nocardioides sp.]